MDKPLRLGLAGYGLVGRRHAAAISVTQGVELSAVIEPDAAALTAAASDGVSGYSTIAEALAAGIDGMILATPNVLHAEQARVCVDAGCPVLIEKPIAVSASEAATLVKEAGSRGVPILVGHHRRHNPIIHRARQIIDDGHIGKIRALQSTCWFYKPDSYFETAPWRRETGAGPISVNLAHDVDLMRHLAGEITSVMSVTRPSERGGDNEDVASALLEFEKGAVGTITVSDSIVAPWSWELTSGEYPIYPRTQESCYFIGGSHGSLSLPQLRVWTHRDGVRDWWTPMSVTAEIRDNSDPLVNQIKHFMQVIRGQAAPIVSGTEGVRTLEVIEAIQSSGRTNTRVELHRTV
jgi:predicted dehydrogenase